MTDNQQVSPPKMPRILALDMAHRMGYSEGEINGSPVSGSILFGGSGAPLTRQLDEFTNWLKEKLSAFPVNVLAIEANVAFAMGSRGATNAGAVKSVWGFVTHAETVAVEQFGFRIHCLKKGGPVMDKSLLLIGPQQARMHFVGKSKFPVKNDGKRAVFLKAQEIGWPVHDFDAADAAAVFDKACAIVAPSRYIKGHSAKFTGRMPSAFRPSIGKNDPREKPAGPLFREMK